MPLLNDTTRNLHRLVYMLDKKAEEPLSQAVGMTFSQFRILLAVHKHAGISQADIAKSHGITEAAISRQIQALCNKGYLTKQRNNNNLREHILGITAEGKTLVIKGLKTYNITCEHIFKTISPTQLQELNSTLEQLMKGLQH